MATTSEDAATGAILDRERRALDRWAQGDEQPLPAWKASVVYGRSDAGWHVVHAHWSTIEED